MFSLWDAYRALHPMYTLLLPERVPGLCELPYSHGGGNGKAMSGLSVEDAQLMQGGTLVFHLKNQPISSTQLLLSRFV
jgi:putative alpha-1,2-mannosidase